MTAQEKQDAVKSLKAQIKDIQNSIDLLKLDLKHAQSKLELFTKQDDEKE